MNIEISKNRLAIPRRQRETELARPGMKRMVRYSSVLQCHVTSNIECKLWKGCSRLGRLTSVPQMERGRISQSIGSIVIKQQKCTGTKIPTDGELMGGIRRILALKYHIWRALWIRARPKYQYRDMDQEGGGRDGEWQDRPNRNNPGGGCGWLFL